MIKSRVLRKLRDGEFVRVAGINRVPDPWLAEVAGRLGFDLIWFDMEHRPYPFQLVSGLSLACRATGMDLMVRVPKTAYTSPMQILEMGATGTMVPHVRSPEEARQWVDWTKFPPFGKRGFDNAGVDCDYTFADPLEYIEHANKETFLVLQIEDREAVECIDEIAAVEGVDVLFVGPADLSLSYGVPMQFKHPLMQKAKDKVANAAAKAGKWWGTVTVTPESAQTEIDRGARMVTCADDHFVLVQGMQQAASRFASLAIRESGRSSKRRR
ncbi:MAG TPA: aldolase/citrate lyase family protein [Candidatus Sulfotelmatobacter sp.]|nr:aldolase/citrate lyase family protein [Candidatus Sulfotelmatobacter sp.]